MSENEVVPDEFRCNRSDGKQWRCKRRALEGKKMCETHTSQLSQKRNKEKAFESMRLVRSRQGDEAASSEIEPNGDGIRANRLGKSKKRKRVMGEAEAVDEAVRKMKLKRGDLQLDLIRMVLKREVEKKKKKRVQNKKSKKKESSSSKGFGDFVGEELTRVLPNGVMAISPPSPTTSNVTSPCDVKVGEEPVSMTKRRFRSKNIEPLPVGKMQVVPYKRDLVNAGKGKKKRCHWCGTKGFEDLITCLSCEREFFCLDCIEKRNKGSKEEVKKKCPVCSGSCRCKACSVTISGVTECKDSQNARSDIDRVLHLHYAVCLLLPVLKGINVEDKVEVENDAEKKEPNPAGPRIHSAESTSDDPQLCSRDSTVVDLGKRCRRRSSVLRLSSDQDRSQGSLSKKVGTVQCSNGIKSYKPPLSNAWDQSLKEALTDCKWKQVKGCSNNLSLKSLFSLDLTRKLEISAEEIVSCYELPEILDKFSGCPFCLGVEKQSSSSDNHLKEASRRREDGTSNFLYYPTVMDFQQNNLEHFQTHWSKGHPVIVRSVLKGGSSLDWDPVAMFCSYLMNRNSITGNTTDCMDWFEVEIGVKQFFLGPLRGKAETNTCQERLKLDGWLSPSLFEEQFPHHFAEILRILPISRYMDPKRGVLNIAANLPDIIQTPNLGPFLNMSYRSGEEYANPDSVKKLGFNTCDTVDILLHVTDTPVSTKQICRIRKLMKNVGRGTSKNPEKKRKSRFGGGKKQDFEASYAQRDWSDDCSSSDSESSQLSLGAKYKASECQGEEREICNDSCEEESLSNSYGAQWDVFQKQDVSKLLEYIKRHSLELDTMDSSKKQVSHPLLEQSYYLDEYHKARLKEEFDVEPWSFDQCVGEAVIVPAGCPYQNRKNRSCVNAVLHFLSPEHVSETIKIVGELSQLPQSVKTKANKIEVKKMAIHKISEAVKEIRELTSSDSTAASRL
ncbi:lysine-specific demethylase JMJ25 isoform X2 [Eutrema salsugineum]|uniref:lysine-specific demethylase JMJ25 isoform X2 n=1 Tax=Eutrema salsugineum TaxID=72664 RepID=UPI000CED2654|nr:lysine-specific demethylase JMJ25 isoform X2 [Eutrema salsugineum]